jgi:hypothetical protein
LTRCVRCQEEERVHPPYFSHVLLPFFYQRKESEHERQVSCPCPCAHLPPQLPSLQPDNATQPTASLIRVLLPASAMAVSICVIIRLKLPRKPFQVHFFYRLKYPLCGYNALSLSLSLLYCSSCYHKLSEIFAAAGMARTQTNLGW